MMDSYKKKWETVYVHLSQASKKDPMTELISDLLDGYDKNGYRLHSTLPKIKTRSFDEGGETEGYFFIFERKGD